ncbi:MAG: hypothetical protein QOH39_3037 [Verrucomicrobiota bacterium]|jgi:hypothetical protein
MDNSDNSTDPAVSTDDSTTPRIRLTSRKGWFAVQKADLALLNEQCGDSAPWIKAVWLALLQIQNDRRSSEFEVPIGFIKREAVVSRSTAKRAIRQLIALGFLHVETQKVAGKKESDVNRYRMIRSGLLEPRVGSTGTERSVLDEGSSESQFLNNSLPKEEERVKQRKNSSKNARAASRGFTGSADAAGAATDASGEKKKSRADSWRPKPRKAVQA